MNTPAQRARQAQLHADLADMLRVDEETGQGRYDTEEILNALIVKYPEWKAKFLKRWTNWKEARAAMLRHVQRTNENLQKQGYAVDFLPRKELPKSYKTDLATKTIVEWFRKQSNVDNLSWKEKEEIIRTLGVV